jgi:capsular exopolysaccharide synthesis family protein
VDLTEYFGGLRRRWKVIAAAVVVAVGAGLLSGFVGPGSSVEQVYEARAAILSTDGQSTNMNNVSVIALYGEVPRRVAEAIDYEGDPRTLSRNVTTEVSAGTGFMWIVGKSKSPDRAALIANTYARELVRVMTQGRVESSLTEADRLQRQMRRMGKRIAAIDARIPTVGPTQAALLTAQRDSAIRQYGLLADRHQQATGISLEPAPIQVLQDAPSGEPADTLAGPLGRTSPASRLALAAILGLLGGVALALVLERFDSRIRTKKSAETHFSLPVLAEIPVTPRRMRGDREVLAAAKPKSPFADSFRLLATGLSGRISAIQRRGGAAPEHVGSARSPQTILVTSPASGEGKTTVTANLAASFAEQGKRVMVLSCDFRSPNIHKMFDVPNDKGLAEALRSPHDDGFLVDGHVKKTSIRQISVVPSSSGADNPGGLLSSDNMEDVLLEAREKADVVLLDTAPILTGAESAVLFPKVDAVLIVARVGTTTVELAERTSDLLSRLGTPVVGVALNASTDVAVSRRDYRDSSKPPAEKSRPSSRRKERRKASKAGPSSKADVAAPKPSTGRDEKSTATAASGGAPGKAAGAAQPRDKGKAKQPVSSEPRSSGGGAAPAEESRGMKKWEL